MVSLTWAHKKSYSCILINKFNIIIFFLVILMGIFFIEILSGIFQIISELFLEHSFFGLHFFDLTMLLNNYVKSIYKHSKSVLKPIAKV